MRGPLAPSHVPIAQSRGERFEDLVFDAVDRLKVRWAKQLSAMEFTIEDVPPTDELLDGPARLSSSEPIPFGRADPAAGPKPAVVVVYRRPLEARTRDRDALGALVHDIVVEQVASLLGLAPETIDPGYDDRH